MIFFAAAAGTAAEFECPIDSTQPPYETWAHSRIASTDRLYQRVHDSLWYESLDSGLQLAISDSLAELLRREPDRARGYVELARFMMSYGEIGEFTLSENAYDIADQALQSALAFDPKSASGWALEGLLRGFQRGFSGAVGDRESVTAALATADRYDPLNAQVLFAWAEWHALNSEYENAEDRLRRLLAAGDLSDAIRASVHRKLAGYYAKLNRPADAVRSAEYAIDVQRHNSRNWLTLSSVALEQAGNTVQALESARTAFCIDASRLANRHIAYALYVAWAVDNSDAERPNLEDERINEAFERHPDVLDVAAYMSTHQRLASLVEVFFAAGLSPDMSTSNDGPTLLYDAVRGGRLAEAERLIEFGADVNRQGETYGSFLTEAVINRDENMVRLLIEHGADVDARSIPVGTTPLIASVKVGGDPRIVKLLLDAGADPELTNQNGETALQLAVLVWDDPMKRRRLVELLLDAGADPEAEIVPGLSIIDHVIEMEDADLAELLLRAPRASEKPSSQD